MLLLVLPIHIHSVICCILLVSFSLATMERIRNNKRKKDFNYFAVSNGYQIGIFTSWNEASKSVIGFSKNSYKGCDTLEEAFAPMRSAGIDDPPVLKHFSPDTGKLSKTPTDSDNVNNNSSKQNQATSPLPINPINAPSGSFSDSDLNLDLYFDANANFNCQQSKPVMVIDHEIDTVVKDLFVSSSHVHKSESDDEIVLSLTKSSNSKHSLDEIQDVSITDVKTISADTQHNDSVKVAQKSTSANSNLLIDVSQKPAIDSFDAAKPTTYYQSFVERTFDILNTIQLDLKSLKEDIKCQRDTTNSMIVNMAKMQEDHRIESKAFVDELKAVKEYLTHQIQPRVIVEDTSSVSPEGVDLKDKSFTCIENLVSSNEKQFSQLMDKCNAIQVDNDNLKLDLQNCLAEQTCLKDQISQNTVAMQQLILKSDMQCDKLQEASTTQQKILKGLDDHVVLSQQLILSCERQNENISKLQNEKSCNPQSHSKTSDMDDSSEKVSNSVQKVEDIKDDAEQAILYSHPLFMAHDEKSPNTNTIPTIKLPDSCSNVLIGDSNVQSLYKKRFDSSGSTEIRTFRNASFLKVCNILNSIDEPFLGVRKVAFCLGTVDCNRKYINFQQIIDDVDNLITIAKKVFPLASIYVVNIAPQLNPKTNSLIIDVNNKLRHHLRNSAVYFVKSDDLWRHVDDKGKPERRMLIGNTQLSSPAVDILLRPLKDLFIKQKQYGISKSNSNPIISSSSRVQMSAEQMLSSQTSHNARFPGNNDSTPIAHQAKLHSSETRSMNTNYVPSHHSYIPSMPRYVAPLHNPTQGSTPRMLGPSPPIDPFSMPVGMMFSFFDYIYKSSNSHNQSQPNQL